ncbi:unnamed protein product [Oncorhynchus mykiss]|uniref:Uncharacterized protein n=1 Tax=Oncorhynchus mykiss TaxID=8022 RepID=A0A060XDT1_ONCMY|nr:unnamed protein product [Oncorhynchus mykiss]
MRRFARVVGPIEHDKFIESHALEFELRREIGRLQEYRRAGIQSFCSAKVYECVKHVREDERRKRTMLVDVLQYIQDGRACQQWLSKQAAIDAGITPVVITTSGKDSLPFPLLPPLPLFLSWSQVQSHECILRDAPPEIQSTYRTVMLICLFPLSFSDLQCTSRTHLCTQSFLHSYIYTNLPVINICLYFPHN